MSSVSFILWKVKHEQINYDFAVMVHKTSEFVIIVYVIAADLSMNSLKDRIFHRALTAQLDTTVPLKVGRLF